MAGLIGETSAYVDVAVLKETRPHERRVALAPSVAVRLLRLGAKLHMQAGAGDAVKLADSAYKDVVIVTDLKALLGEADVVLAGKNSAARCLPGPTRSAARYGKIPPARPNV